VTREGVAGLPHEHEAGGLSGAPLRARAISVARQLAQALAGELPVIGVGGIMNGPDARERIAAGASLVQLYTGLVYRGPALVRECIAALCSGAGPNSRQ
jgi:dihydroorotate dehydrogenase